MNRPQPPRTRTTDTVTIYIGIGSNIGNAGENCLKAAGLLGKATGVASVRVSSLYATEPQGLRAQDWFVNVVAELKTELSPMVLFRLLGRIENEMGRETKHLFR